MVLKSTLVHHPSFWWGTRLSILALGGLPALFGALAEFSTETSPASAPWWTDIRSPLPVFHALELLQFIADDLISWTLLGTCLVWVAHTFWQLCFFHNLHTQSRLSSLLQTSWLHLPRALVLGGILGAVFALGAALSLFVLWRGVLYAQGVGWDAWVGFGVLPAATLCLILLWFWVVGSVALCTKVALVAQPHEGLRALLLRGVRLYLREWRPFTARFACVVVGTQAVSGLVWVAWRQSAPSTQGLVMVAFWCVLWCAAMSVQAYMSVWLHRSFYNKNRHKFGSDGRF